MSTVAMLKHIHIFHIYEIAEKFLDATKKIAAVN
jgi:hypothetical protein